MLHFEDPGSATLVAGSGAPYSELPNGSRVPTGPGTIGALVRASGRVERLERFDPDAGALAAYLHRLGISSAVGAPIAVQGRAWGMLLAGALRPAACAHGGAPGRVRRARRRGGRQRGVARRARRLARPHRHRRRRGTAPDRARPARRDPAAARLPRPGAARRAVRDRRAPARGAAQDRRRRRRPHPHDRRPARDLPRDPSRLARRRPRPGAEGARTPLRRPRRARCRGADPVAEPHPGGDLLHRLRGAHERVQARARVGRAAQRRPRPGHRSGSPSPTTGSAAPTRSAAPA